MTEVQRFAVTDEHGVQNSRKTESRERSKAVAVTDERRSPKHQEDESRAVTDERRSPKHREDLITREKRFPLQTNGGVPKKPGRPNHVRGVKRLPFQTNGAVQNASRFERRTLGG